MFPSAANRSFRAVDLSGAHTRAMRVLFNPDDDRPTMLMTAQGRDAIKALGRAFMPLPTGREIADIGRRMIKG